MQIPSLRITWQRVILFSITALCVGVALSFRSTGANEPFVLTLPSASFAMDISGISSVRNLITIWVAFLATWPLLFKPSWLLALIAQLVVLADFLLSMRIGCPYGCFIAPFVAIAIDLSIVGFMATSCLLRRNLSSLEESPRIRDVFKLNLAILLILVVVGVVSLIPYVSVVAVGILSLTNVLPIFALIGLLLKGLSTQKKTT